MNQDGVGEVVVFVDQDVQRDVVLVGVLEQPVELPVDAGCGEDALHRRIGKEVGVALHSPLKLREAILLKAFLQSLQLVVEGGEIEAQDDVAVAVRRGPPPDVGAAEDGLELLGLLAVVVAFQCRKPEAFAEAPGTNQEDVAFPLQIADEAGLIDIQAPLLADALEVGEAVGDGGAGCIKRCGHDPVALCWRLASLPAF